MISNMWLLARLSLHANFYKGLRSQQTRLLRHDIAQAPEANMLLEVRGYDR